VPIKNAHNIMLNTLI
jgi:hypothetical protein